jgi:quercetin dioxygenase-like cupin family protein
MHDTPRHIACPPLRSREGSLYHRLPELADLGVASCLPRQAEEEAELAMALVELPLDGAIPLHLHPEQGEALLVTKGTVVVQRGKGKAELRALAAAYFPANVPHGITAGGHEGAEVLLCHPVTSKARQQLSSRLLDTSVSQSDWPNPNVIAASDLAFRWALAAESEPWVPIEPSKGFALKLKYLFDPPRGAPDLVVGLGHHEAGHHYTLHHHEPAEVYYILEGSGVVHVGEEAFEVESGSMVYVPPMARHGIDTSDTLLKHYWIYGLQNCGPSWTWEAEEPIWDFPSSPPEAL